MGRRRGKMKIEFIHNKKSRNLAFKQRKECLVKKIKELSTLCDVNACMIVYAPDHDAPTAPATVWPPNDPAQVRRMIDLYRAKNVQDFKNDGDEGKQDFKNDGGKTQFGVSLQKKAQLVSARIDELKSERRRELMDDDADQDFKNDGGDEGKQDLKNDDGDEGKAQFGVFLQKKSQLVRARIDELKSERQREIMDADQDQFFPTITTMDLDNSSMYLQDSSTALMMPRGPLMVDDSFDDDDDELKQRELMGYQYPQQQQYQLFGPVVDLDQSCCSGMGLEGTSCRQTVGDDDVAVQDFYDDDGEYNFIAQLCTPPQPMMMWQSIDDDLMFTQDTGAADYLQYIDFDFDDLWV